MPAPKMSLTKTRRTRRADVCQFPDFLPVTRHSPQRIRRLCASVRTLIFRLRSRILQVSGARCSKFFGKHHFDQALVGHIAAVGFAFDRVQ